MPIHKYFIAFLLLLSTSAQAQLSGFTELKNTPLLKQSLLRSSAGITTISSDFLQVKHMKLLSEEMRSKGKFYYQKPEKIRIQYAAPYQYLVVYAQGQMLVKDEQKTNRVNAKGSKSMQSLNRIMIDCMSGRIFDNRDFQVKAYENKHQYALHLKPVDAGMAKIFQDIIVQLGKLDLQVDKLKMTEKGGDVTEMTFSNTKTNLPLQDALFKTR